MTDDTNFLSACLQRIATGPELSKDLSLEEAQRAMGLILQGRVHPVQVAVFLVALRMKRETVDENRGILAALREAASFAQANVDDLVEYADPYDGVNRHLPASPFLAAALAACGIPAVCHGVDRLGPKYGLTLRRVLAAADKPVDLTPAEAAARISDPQTGWAYVDASRYCPALGALSDLRRLIVKRPCLATLEKLTGPVRARGSNHLVIGYVHKAYPELLTALARHAGYASALVLRGVEGGVMPAIKGATAYRRYHDIGIDEVEVLDAAEVHLEAGERAAPLPTTLLSENKLVPASADAAAEETAQAGLAALAGKGGPLRNQLMLGTALILVHLGRASGLQAGAAQAARVLDNGEALRRFGNFR